MLCTAESQFFCDEGPFGKGTGGQLRYTRQGPGARRADPVDRASPAPTRAPRGARRSCAGALADPAARSPTRSPRASSSARNTQLSLPGDQRLEQGIDVGQAEHRRPHAARGRPEDPRRRRGQGVPAAAGHRPARALDRRRLPGLPVDLRHRRRVHGVRGGRPSGQFEAIKDHARALRDVSVILNGDSGKVAHEIVGDGSVYFGACKHAGNTDETAKFPSLVALDLALDRRRRVPRRPVSVRRAQHALRRRAARRGRRRLARGPRQRRARRDGRGEARQHRLHDPRPLRPRRHGAGQARRRATAPWARQHARDLRARFEAAWWYGAGASSTPTRSTIRAT